MDVYLSKPCQHNIKVEYDCEVDDHSRSSDIYVILCIDGITGTTCNKIVYSKFGFGFNYVDESHLT
jgi:hypothetical protein